MSEAPVKRRRRALFPKTLGECVEPLTRPVFKAQGIASARLITDWEKIVGRECARRCLPHKITFPQGKTTGGTLTLAVENGFAPQLQHSQPLILERLAVYFGYKAVSRITLIPATARPAPKPAARKAPPLPADCVAAAQQAQDDELREALASLANALSQGST